MPRIRPLLPLLLLAACAPSGPTALSEIAARMPERVADQHRLEPGRPEPGLVARYASPNGNRASLFLTPDPAVANLPDGFPAEVLEPQLERAQQTLGRELLARGAVPGIARVQTRGRLPTDTVTCLLAPVTDPPSMETLCLAVVAGQVGQARISVAGILGNDRDRTVYAGHMGVFFLQALGRATPHGGIAPAGTPTGRGAEATDPTVGPDTPVRP